MADGKFQVAGMSAQEAYHELTAMHRHYKAFAKLDEVLQAAAVAERDQAEKQRLLSDLSEKVATAKQAAIKHGQDLAEVQLAYTEKLGAAQRTYLDEQEQQALAHQAKTQELAAERKAVEETRRLVAREREALERVRAETARLVVAEEAKVEAAGAAKLKTLNDQAFALQTKISELKLQLRTTVDHASHLL